jgi:hypothetical protein
VHRSQRREAEKRSSIVRQPRGGDSRHIPIWGKYDENNASRAREEVEMLFFSHEPGTTIQESRSRERRDMCSCNKLPRARVPGDPDA